LVRKPGDHPPCGNDGLLGAPVNTATLAENFKLAVGDRVFFSEGSAGLGARARVALEAQAGWLRRHAGLSVVLEGHADDPGTNALNAQLARDRAEAVRQRLIDLGVAPERIILTSFGRERTITDCGGAVCAAQNRRVVTAIGQAAARPAR
jgi:peptidoglycan-associated lipoprotein